MNQKDNIERFFQKRFQNDSPEEESWNVPSDDLWNQAKVHFPKEKEKKRPFFFLRWGGAILILLVTAAALLFLYNDTKSVKTTEQNIAETNIALNSISNTNPSDHKNQEVTERTAIKTQQDISLPRESLITKDRSLTLETISEPKVADSTSPTFEKSIIATEVIQPTSDNPSSKKTSSDVIILLTEKEHENSSPEKKSPLKKTILSLGDKSAEKKVTVPSKDIMLPPLELSPTVMAINNLPSLSSTLETDDKPLETKPALPFIKPRRSYRKWEVGLSVSPFIINPEWLIENEETEPGETYNLKLKYSNINVPISRRLGRRFSLTSGISLAQLKFDFGFTTSETYIDNETESELRDIIRDGATSGSLAINDESTDIEIVFKPEADLEDGDELFVKGFIPIKLQVVQIPFLLNYHFGKRKLEGLIHVGAGLDYFYGEIISVDLAAFNDNQLVTEPVEFDGLTSSDFDFSLYFGAGMKYHFTDRFNIGISTKLDFTELLLSRHEIGVYYRF